MKIFKRRSIICDVSFFRVRLGSNKIVCASKNVNCEVNQILNKIFSEVYLFSRFIEIFDSNRFFEK